MFKVVILVALSFSMCYKAFAHDEKDIGCLIEAIYFEARSEPIAGQIAVATTIVNRTSNKNFQKTICDVVHNKVKIRGMIGRYRCSYSYWCDTKRKTMTDPAAVGQATLAATLSLQGLVAKGTDNVLYYHALYRKPYWAYEQKYITRIGNHLFYE